MKSNRVYRVLLPVFLALLAWATQWPLQGVLERFESQPTDSLMRRLPNTRKDPTILLVGVDDETFRREAFSREAHAQFLANMMEAGARAVFLDIIFDVPRDEEIDVALAEAVWENGHTVLGNVLGIVRVREEDREIQVLRREPLIEPLEICFNEGKAMPGLINTFPDVDGVVRSIPLALRAPEMPDLLPGPALAMFAQAQPLRLSELKYSADTESILAPPRRFAARYYNSIPESPRTGVERYMAPISYLPRATGPAAKADPASLPVLPYHELLDPTSDLLTRAKDKLVVVGENSSADTDVYPTPVGPMKGFEIHAQALNTLLQGPIMQPVPDWVGSLVSLLICLGLAFGIMRARDKWTALAAALAVLGGQVAIDVLAYLEGWQAQIITPLALSFLTILLAVTARLMSTASILERYVPPEVVSAMLAVGHTRPRSGTATVIVTDIRGYTTLSEGRTPIEVLRLLNDYHSVTVAIYEKHGGRALTYQGDAQIIAFLPSQGLVGRRRRNPAANALRAAREMQHAVNVLRLEWGLVKQTDFDVGLAVCTGPVTIGEIGTTGAGRAEYTVIGQTVRLAHKIQSLSQELGYSVLLDEATLKSSTLSLHVERFEKVLEGQSETTTFYGLRSTEEQT